MATPRKGIVYTLTDPRDGAIRYVGKTTKAPLERLAQHLSSPTNPAMRVWLTTLGGQGLLPRMDTLVTVPVERLDAEESKQIAKHAKHHRLLNAPYYQTNLADLWSAKQGSEPPAGPRAQSPYKVAANALLLRGYGAIAAARAAGKLPAYAAFFLTLLLAPVLLAGILVLRVVKTRFCLRLVFFCMVCTYLWQLGFDHAARDLVLAHLPAAGALEFWHEYLARPLGALGLRLAGIGVFAVWATYPGMVKAAKGEKAPNA